MDFDRIKGAVEHIELPREARERILSAEKIGHRKPKLVFNLGPRLVLAGICILIIAAFWLAPKLENKIVINDYPRENYIKRIWNEEEHETQIWDWEQTVAYFGRNVLPDPAPEGLTLLNEMDYNAVTVLKDTGEIVCDNQSYIYWSDYTQTYYPELDRTVKNQTGDGSGFCLMVSRSETGSDMVFVWPDGTEASMLENTEVLIGGFTEEAADETEEGNVIYGAEFLYDGVYYRVRTFNMEQDQVIELLISLMHE